MNGKGQMGKTKKVPASLQVLGLQEIAELLEVKPRTPHTWAFRKLLPDADYASVNGHVAWKRSTIVKWAAKHGRLPESGVLNVEGQKYLPKVDA